MASAGSCPPESEETDFRERIDKGFREALRSGVDIVVSVTSILVKIGEGFTELSQGRERGPWLLHPMVLARLVRAFPWSKLARRGLLPRDLWRPRAILGWGVDTSIFKGQAARYWGKLPYEFSACTEGGVMALQAWNRRGLTLVPYSDFFEFVPEEDSLKSREDKAFRPQALLPEQLEENKRYELVLTSFYGMPFFRYRVGHWVKLVSLGDQETGVKLPQLAFEGRSDDRIDVAGFTRIDEKTIWEALAKAGLRTEEWTLRKEYLGEKPILHLYAEFKGGLSDGTPGDLFHESLKTVDPFYADLERMLEIRPLEVTSLSSGTFERYYDEKKGEGLDLGQLRPPRMNATDPAIRDLLRLSRAGATEG